MEEKLMRNPYYVRAMDFIRNTDLNSLENGRHVLDGDNLFVNIVDSSMKTPQQARLEVHDRYIDVQVPLSGTEMFGVKPRKDCTMPDGEMDAENDILFYDIRQLLNLCGLLSEAYFIFHMQSINCAELF